MHTYIHTYIQTTYIHAYIHIYTYIYTYVYNNDSQGTAIVRVPASSGEADLFESENDGGEMSAQEREQAWHQHHGMYVCTYLLFLCVCMYTYATVYVCVALIYTFV
jgi:hypothetical protein